MYVRLRECCELVDECNYGFVDDRFACRWQWVKWTLGASRPELYLNTKNK